ncbi:MAG: hypothetical protein ACKOC1_10680 [Hyphomicrobiales bacterium]
MNSFSTVDQRSVKIHSDRDDRRWIGTTLDFYQSNHVSSRSTCDHVIRLDDSYPYFLRRQLQTYPVPEACEGKTSLIGIMMGQGPSDQKND